MQKTYGKKRFPSAKAVYEFDYSSDDSHNRTFNKNNVSTLFDVQNQSNFAQSPSIYSSIAQSTSVESNSMKSPSIQSIEFKSIHTLLAQSTSVESHVMESPSIQSTHTRSQSSRLNRKVTRSITQETPHSTNHDSNHHFFNQQSTNKENIKVKKQSKQKPIKIHRESLQKYSNFNEDKKISAIIDQSIHFDPDLLKSSIASDHSIHGPNDLVSSKFESSEDSHQIQNAIIIESDLNCSISDVIGSDMNTLIKIESNISLQSKRKLLERKRTSLENLIDSSVQVDTPLKPFSKQSKISKMQAAVKSPKKQRQISPQKLIIIPQDTEDSLELIPLPSKSQTAPLNQNQQKTTYGASRTYLVSNNHHQEAFKYTSLHNQNKQQGLSSDEEDLLSLKTATCLEQSGVRKRFDDEMRYLEEGLALSSNKSVKRSAITGFIKLEKNDVFWGFFRMFGWIEKIGQLLVGCTEKDVIGLGVYLIFILMEDTGNIEYLARQKNVYDYFMFALDTPDIFTQASGSKYEKLYMEDLKNLIGLTMSKSNITLQFFILESICKMTHYLHCTDQRVLDYVVSTFLSTDTSLDLSFTCLDILSTMDTSSRYTNAVMVKSVSTIIQTSPIEKHFSIFLKFLGRNCVTDNQYESHITAHLIDRLIVCFESVSFDSILLCLTLFLQMIQLFSFQVSINACTHTLYLQYIITSCESCEAIQ